MEAYAREKKQKRKKNDSSSKKKKQLYQARIRFQIRTKLFTQSDPDSGPDQETPNHKPMSPDEHVKALADWFMKEGAEELWNEDDGPVKSEQRPKFSGGANQRPISTGAPIDLKRLAADKRSLVNNSGNVVNSVNVNSSNYVKNRNHSVLSKSNYLDRNLSSGLSFACNFVGNYGETVTKLKNGSDFGRTYFSGIDNRGFCRNESSLGESGSDYGRGDMVKSIARNLRKNCGNGNLRNVRGDAHKKALLGKRRFKQNESSSSDDDDLDFDLEDADEKVEGWRDVKKMGSSASLGKYDMKIMKRVPLKSLEEEYNFSEQVELIRNEISKNRLVESEGKQEKSEEPILSQKRFDECGISPVTFKAITVAGYVQMTRVQEATLSVCFDGKDALVKAKTCTGKSLAFLLPAIEAVLKATSSSKVQRVPPIFILILCPTRELASQLAAEAVGLLKYHDGIGVLTVVGGTHFKVDQKRLESDPCQIPVATPGRLLDHIENKSGLSVRLMGLKMLILYEADHLLDLGFRKDVEKIVDCLPRQRHSLLFSATIPKEVRRICQLVLTREHVYIDTVGLDSVETPSKIKQSCLVAQYDIHFQLVHHILKEHVSEVPDYKEMKLNAREIHSRKPQLYRDRISEEFRESKRLILVTSDVSARGMNYPDFTLVVQVGIPCDREQYLHRLGRTEE